MPTPKRPVVAIDRITGEVTARFDCAQDAADAFGISVAFARSECRNRRVSSTRFDALRFADDPEPIRWWSQRTRCVVASDGKTVHAWPCISMAADDSSLSICGVKGRIARGTTLDLLGRERYCHVWGRKSPVVFDEFFCGWWELKTE